MFEVGTLEKILKMYLKYRRSIFYFFLILVFKYFTAMKIIIEIIMMINNYKSVTKISEIPGGGGVYYNISGLLSRDSVLFISPRSHCFRVAFSVGRTRGVLRVLRRARSS